MVMASWRTPSNSAIGNRSTQHLRVDRLAQTPFLVTMDLCFSVLASIYNQLEKEEAWKKGESPKRRDIMLQLDISFLLYCFVFLPKALPVVPHPPDRHPNYFLPSSSDKACEQSFTINGARVFIFRLQLTCARALSLSLSSVFPYLSYLAVCPCRANVVAGHPLCWLQLVRMGCSFVCSVCSVLFFSSVWCRGVGLLRAYSKQSSPVVVPISCVIEKAILCRVFF
jgi:hypothetical protein